MSEVLSLFLKNSSRRTY